VRNEGSKQAPPTRSQLDAIRVHRLRDGVPLEPLPETRSQASAELRKYQHGKSRNAYAIRSKHRRKAEEQYNARRQAEIEATHARLKAEFLARNPQFNSEGRLRHESP
jgi:hypothetical protein